MSHERYKTVVKRQHVRRREILVLVFALLMALALGSGFYLGQRAAYSGMGIEPEIYRTMAIALPQMERHSADLERQLGVQKARHELNRTALEMVRKELTSQKDEIAYLEEGLGFYKGLMAPGEITQGLSLRKIELLATDTERLYTYRIVAQQEARKHGTLKGELSVELLGQQAGEQVTYPLAELSDSLQDNKIVLRFRYFQAIEGQLTLPEGFEPEAVNIVAKSKTPRKAELRERFPWLVQERFTHAGK